MTLHSGDDFFVILEVFFASADELHSVGSIIIIIIIIGCQSQWL